jgi:hypothetical protein
MKGQLKKFGFLTSVTLVLAAAPGIAAAQQATLYEIVENMDVVKLSPPQCQEYPGECHRVSNWTAQGTADRDSPFCPGYLLPEGVDSCTITAFGTDDIELNTFSGKVWANIVAVANLDNTVDGPEGAVYTGQITGVISFRQPPTADLKKTKMLLGPAVPLIYVTDGKFYPDQVPTIRTSPGAPPAGNPALFNSTFRLPFAVAQNGARERVVRGKKAYYLGDNGSLIAVDRLDESALGFPLLRAEVFFQ